MDNRLRLTINFREKDRELYNYIMKNSEIIGASAFIKILVKNDMEKKEDK